MPNNLQQSGLDPVDRLILAKLGEDARIPNNALAEAVGIAPSTCHARLRSLRARGVIRGFHADLDFNAVGLPVQAMISVRLHAHTRGQMDAFLSKMPELPGVIAVYFMSGADDYVIHVAMPSAQALRDFVLDHLSSEPAVQHTNTSLIFDYRRGKAIPSQR
ncbi:Lrp/AsnC family transcriptional regulator [Fodinicola acaciae]|uniref:Lrp/AsnC family transcriptional regulator n=1 Tax=Fodinicola acaciae TaxID=2681555 RepID=UPI0013D22663|nr:Lrp/AsnC family transcriptional regulator [Fodinicola acaciae]